MIREEGTQDPGDDLLKKRSRDDITLQKAYKNALRKAWDDGRLSEDERSILEQFQDDLPLPDETLALLEAREYLRFRYKEYETSPYEHQLGIIEKHQGLQGRVGRLTNDRANITGRCIKYRHGRRRRSPTPKSI